MHRHMEFSILLHILINANLPIFVSFLIACRRGVKRKGIKKIPHNLTSLYNFMRRRLFAEFCVGTFHKNCAAPYSEAFCHDNRYPSLEYRCSCTHHLPFTPAPLPSGFTVGSARERQGGREKRYREFFGGKSRRSFNDMPYSSCLACGPYYPLTEGFHKALLPWKWMEMSSREDKRSRWCTGLDRSFLSSYRIHLDVESSKLSLYLSF